MKETQPTHPLLVSVHFIVRVGGDEDEAGDLIRQFETALESSGSKLLPNAKEHEGWVGASSTYLDSGVINAGRCAECHRWCTDCEKLDSLAGIDRGATHQGRLLCDECLPVEHPWAFKSRIPKRTD